MLRYALVALMLCAGAVHAPAIDLSQWYVEADDNSGEGGGSTADNNDFWAPGETLPECGTIGEGLDGSCIITPDTPETPPAQADGPTSDNCIYYYYYDWLNGGCG